MMPCCGGTPVAKPLTFINSPQMQGRVPGQTFPLPLNATMNVMGSVDDFNRPDSSSLGPGWTTNVGTSNIIGGRLCCDGSGVASFSRFSRDGQPPDDQYVEVRVVAISGVSTAQASAGVRGSLDVAGSKPGYFVELGNFANIRLWKNATGALLATAAGINPVAGDVIRLEVVGNQLTVKRNGIIIIGPFTDSTVASGWPFVRTFGTVSAAFQVDDFKCDGMPATNPVKATSHSLAASMSTFAGDIAKFTSRSLDAVMSTFTGVVAKLTAIPLDASMSTFAGALTKRVGKVLSAAMACLGGSLVSLVALATDDFNRADGALGANWTKFSGWTGAAGIFTNLVTTAVANTPAATAYTGAGAVNDDQYAQIVMRTPNNAAIIGPAVRVSITAKNAYVLRLYQGGFFMYRIQNGSVAKSFFPASLPTYKGGFAGDVFRLEVTGNSLRAYQNGILMASVQDDGASGGVISSGYPGIWTDTGDGLGGGTKGDDWEGGNAFATGPVKFTSHLITASMSTFSGLVAKLSTHSFAASMSTFSAVVSKKALKSLSASMSTFAGVVSRKTLKSLSASMSTFSGALARRILKVLSGSMSAFSASLAKLTRKALSGSMSLFSAILGMALVFVPRAIKSGGSSSASYNGRASNKTYSGDASSDKEIN